MNSELSEETPHELADVVRRCREARDGSIEKEAELGTALIDLGCSLRNTGHHTWAFNTLQQAVDCLRSIRSRASDESRDNEARAILLIGNLYRDAEKFAEAEASYNESIELRRRICRVAPDAMQAGLALSLNAKAVLYTEQKHSLPETYALYEEALKAARIALPETTEGNIDIILRNLMALFRGRKNYSAAVVEFEECISVLEGLAAGNDSEYLPHLAVVTANLGVLYGRHQSWANADSCSFRAIQLWQQLVRTDEKAYSHQLAGELIRRSQLCKDIDRDWKRAREYATMAYETMMRGSVNPLSEEIWEDAIPYWRYLGSRIKYANGHPGTLAEQIAFHEKQIADQ